MNSEARMKWDAEKAFAKLNDKLRPEPAPEPHEYTGSFKVPYAPPSNITPERLAQLKRYEPVKHGRDIESLMRYHKAHLKGRTDDDCLREKFGSVAQSAEHRPIHDKPNGPCKLEVAGSMPAAPTTPPPPAADELYEPVGTMPVVGDKVIVLEADGTPYNGDDAGKPQEVLSVHSRECVTGYCELKMEYFCAPHPICKIQNRILKRTQAKTQAPDDVATGRAWKCEGPDACYSWLAQGWALFGARKG